MTEVGGKSLRLLLNLLDARELRFTRAALLHHGTAGEELIRSGLIAARGYELAAADDEDGRPARVRYDENHAGLGYRDSAGGWVSVEQATLELFSPRVDRLFQVLLGDNLSSPAKGPLDVEPDLVWEIGSAYLTHPKSSVVWFARRLKGRDDLNRLESACRRRPSPGLRPILTNTPYHRIPAVPLPNACIISIDDVLSARAPAEIDFDVLKARYAGTVDPAIMSPLHLSRDGRVLTIHGRTHITFRGPIQMEIIRLLVEAHGSGRGLRAEDLLTRAKSASDSLDQAFGSNWPKLKPFLKSEGGLWRFVI